MIPSWLPDWQDASQYPPEKGTTGTQWAWEFLRRNPEYKNRFDNLEPGEMLVAFHITEWLPVKSFPVGPWEKDPGRIVFSGQKRYPEENWFIPPDDPYTLPPLGTFHYRDPGKIYLQFDLGLPIGPQMKEARKTFRELAKKIRKPRIGKFSDYLRILDAKTENPKISNLKISEVLYPDERDEENGRQRIYNNDKSARQFRDNDFWKIPLFL